MLKHVETRPNHPTYSNFTCLDVNDCQCFSLRGAVSAIAVQIQISAVVSCGSMADKSKGMGVVSRIMIRPPVCFQVCKALSEVLTKVIVVLGNKIVHFESSGIVIVKMKVDHIFSHEFLNLG